MVPLKSVGSYSEPQNKRLDTVIHDGSTTRSIPDKDLFLTNRPRGSGVQSVYAYLRQHGDRLAQLRQPELGNIDTVDQNCARSELKHAEQGEH